MTEAMRVRSVGSDRRIAPDPYISKGGEVGEGVRGAEVPEWGPGTKRR